MNFAIVTPIGTRESCGDADVVRPRAWAATLNVKTAPQHVDECGLYHSRGFQRIRLT